MNKLYICDKYFSLCAVAPGYTNKYKRKHEYLSRPCVIKLNVCFLCREILFAFIEPLWISLYIKYTYYICSAPKLTAALRPNTGNVTLAFNKSNYIQLV